MSSFFAHLAFFVGLMHCLQDPQVLLLLLLLLFQKNNFKTGSHSTIHTFKIYFVIMFSDFSNKWYSNKS